MAISVGISIATVAVAPALLNLVRVKIALRLTTLICFSITTKETQRFFPSNFFQHRPTIGLLSRSPSSPISCSLPSDAACPKHLSSDQICVPSVALSFYAGHLVHTLCARRSLGATAFGLSLPCGIVDTFVYCSRLSSFIPWS